MNTPDPTDRQSLAGIGHHHRSVVCAVQSACVGRRLTLSATIRDVTAERLEPAHRRSVLLVIIVTQLVVALVTGLVIWTAYDRLNGNIKPGRELDHRVKKEPLSDGEPLTSW